MKRFLLAGASLLALLAGSPAEAATLMFGYTGAIVPYVVPETGTYQIIAWGAEGGGSPGSAVGGLGAEIGGDVSLLANTRLEILVGQMGASGKEKYAGGGGGSFVFLKIGEPPLIAAGGGSAGGAGATQNPNKGQNGYDGRTVGSGSDGFGMVIHRGSGGYGGGGGTGGGAYQTGGGAGAGALGGGTNGTGGAIGGYGGGGGHSYSDFSGGVSYAGSGKGGVSGTGSFFKNHSYGGGGGGGGYSGGGGGQGAYASKYGGAAPCMRDCTI
jgi:hypothetical protein